LLFTVCRPLSDVWCLLPVMCYMTCTTVCCTLYAVHSLPPEVLLRPPPSLQSPLWYF
jgi:hypothetical protein